MKGKREKIINPKMPRRIKNARRDVKKKATPLERNGVNNSDYNRKRTLCRHAE
jgi:hypothetical protein